MAVLKGEQMNLSLGVAVAMVGLVIMTVGVVGTNVVFFRSLPKLANRQLIRATPIIAFDFTLWLLAWAAVAMIGIAILLLGLVLTGGLVSWAPLAPLAVVVLMIPPAWYARWRIQRLRYG